MTKKHQELVKRYDRNGDGRLDDDEKAAAHAAMRKAGGERKEGAKAEREWRMEMLKRFDKDGDGRLDEREKEAARKAFMEKRARRLVEKKEP